MKIYVLKSSWKKYEDLSEEHKVLVRTSVMGSVRDRIKNYLNRYSPAKAINNAKFSSMIDLPEREAEEIAAQFISGYERLELFEFVEREIDYSISVCKYLYNTENIYNGWLNSIQSEYFEEVEI